LERNAELGISLHVFEENLLAAAIIKLRRPTICAAGDSLCGFNGALQQNSPLREKPLSVQKVRVWEPFFTESTCRVLFFSSFRLRTLLFPDALA
jgi:hypothetical protein